MRDPLFELLSTARSLVVVANKEGLRDHGRLTFHLHPETHDEIRMLAKEAGWPSPLDFDSVLFEDRLWGIPLREDKELDLWQVMLRWEIRA